VHVFAGEQRVAQSQGSAAAVARRGVELVHLVVVLVRAIDDSRAVRREPEVRDVAELRLRHRTAELDGVTRGRSERCDEQCRGRREGQQAQRSHRRPPRRSRKRTPSR
jgi:hypothetical protein